MINGVNFNPNIAQSCPKTDVPVTQPSFEGNCEMPSEVSSAYRAYGLANINKQDYINLKLNEFIAILKAQRKNFEIEENGDRPRLHVYNENGQEVLRSEYNGDTQKLLGAEILTYRNDKIIRKIFKDDKNSIRMYEDYYYNDEIPQEAFTKDKLTYDTTPEEYIKYLNQNNINYKIEKDGEEDNNRSIHIDEFDENDKRIQSTWFYYGENKFGEKHQFLSRSSYDSNEAETKRITFDDNSTEVCTYLMKHKGKTYKTKDINPEYFTQAKITYNTTPEQYISYLKQNGIKYKIKHAGSTIIEYDSKGEEKVTTSWIHENGNFERICRWELNDKNSRRLDFYKDETYVCEGSYD